MGTSSSLVRSVALGLLRAARIDGKVALVARRVRGVGALVVLHVARPRQRVRQVLKQRVALNLELIPRGRNRGSKNASECPGKSLEISSCCG